MGTGFLKWMFDGEVYAQTVAGTLTGEKRFSGLSGPGLYEMYIFTGTEAKTMPYFQ